FTADPLGRLSRSLQYVFAVVLPEAQPAHATVTNWVQHAHDPVEGIADGARYSAADPETQRWVTATLYWTAEQIRWRIWGEQHPDDAEQIYRNYAVLGTALGMPHRSEERRVGKECRSRGAPDRARERRRGGVAKE